MESGGKRLRNDLAGDTLRVGRNPRALSDFRRFYRSTTLRHWGEILRSRWPPHFPERDSGGGFYNGRRGAGDATRTRRVCVRRQLPNIAGDFSSEFGRKGVEGTWGDRQIVFGFNAHA